MLRAAPLIILSAISMTISTLHAFLVDKVRLPLAVRDRGSLSQGQDAVAYGADTPRCKFSSTHIFTFCSVINLLARTHAYGLTTFYDQSRRQSWTSGNAGARGSESLRVTPSRKTVTRTSGDTLIAALLVADM
jgi:hypothetical protein